MIEIFLLSLIQGITEFLPISSSSHLIIFSNYTEFTNRSLSIDISLHIGSFIAVITYFYKDIADFVKNRDLFLKIIISSIPVMIIGFFLVQSNLIEQLRNINTNLNYKSAIYIGLFQVFSLMPGVSRSGISITAARFLKFKRFDAAKISFLLSIPTLGAVSMFGLKNVIFSQEVSISILNLISILLSFIFSFVTIKYFLKYIKNFNLNIFVYYRITLGVILLSIAYL